VPIVAEQLSEVRRHIASAVSFDHLVRFDWRRQTDAVQLVFIVARLFADCGDEATFVDGHINDWVKKSALGAGGGVKQFFNRRFHDAGFKSRRVLFFDTQASRKMAIRNGGKSKLHFHAVLARPMGWSDADIKRFLKRIFGGADEMGRRQFHISKPRWDQHHTHNDVQVTGPLGKIVYVITHAGTTYANLSLNGGKRSRRCPPSRGSCNKRAGGLARGIPSNFHAE
jgi:hypothetical protein